MYPHVAHVFIDGAYLRARGLDFSAPYPDPRHLARSVVGHSIVQDWAAIRSNSTNTLLGRVTYYDAAPDGGADPALQEYWRTIELQPDTHLRFGALQGLKAKARQKGVDVQLAVDMLAGSFAGLFDVAVLVAGDADFVPVVEEVKRHGVMVVVSAAAPSLSDALLRVADRLLPITKESQLLRSLPISVTLSGT